MKQAITNATIDARNSVKITAGIVIAEFRNLRLKSPTSQACR